LPLKIPKITASFGEIKIEWNFIELEKNGKFNFSILLFVDSAEKVHTALVMNTQNINYSETDIEIMHSETSGANDESLY